MAVGEIHVGDTILFMVTVKDQDNTEVDISSATTRNFLFEKPDGSLSTFAGDFITNGVDGGLQYKTSTADLSTAGNWKYQVHIIIGTDQYHTDITKFKVKSNLPV